MSKFKILMPLLLTVCLLAGMPALAATGNSSTPSSSSSNPSTSSIMEQPQGAVQFHAFNASDLIGKTVLDQKGETLGEVRDVVIGTDGRVDFVILSHGSFADFDLKYVPIPFQTFMSSTTNSAEIDTASYVISNLDKAKLDRAPMFSNKNWNTIKASKDKICSYYGAGQCPSRFM